MPYRCLTSMLDRPRSLSSNAPFERQLRSWCYMVINPNGPAVIGVFGAISQGIEFREWPEVVESGPAAIAFGEANNCSSRASDGPCANTLKSTEFLPGWFTGSLTHEE